MSIELFDANYYLAANPDLAAVGITNPTELKKHFETAGLEEGRLFSPLVDLNYYRQKNVDLASAKLTTYSQIFNHLQRYGIAEGRPFSPLVDLDFYLDRNPDLAGVFGGNRELAFEHLRTNGIREKRQFSQFIDLNYYLNANPDVAQAVAGDGWQALQHLLQIGIAEGRNYLPGDLGIVGGFHSVGADPNLRPVVSSIDSEDYYKFRLDSFRDVSVNVEGESAQAQIQLIRDRNNNGLLDEIEVQQSLDADKSPLSQLDRFGLSPGTYFVKVSESAGDTRYQMRLSTTPARILSQPDFAGNAIAGAWYMGDLTRPQAINGFIGNGDSEDFYSFNINGTSDVNIKLEGLSGDTILEVIQDRNGNGAIDPGELLDTQSGNNSALIDLNGDGQIDLQEYITSLRQPEKNDPFPSSVQLFNLAAGTYFVRIARVGEDTAYDLRINSIPSGMPASGARNGEPIGFGQIGVLRDRFEVADFIGEANPYDMYQFTLENTRQVELKLDRLAQPTDLFLIHDINKDDLFTFQEFIVFPADIDSSAPEINRVLGAGNYYLGVVKNGGNTPYLLTTEESDPNLPPDAAGNSLATATDVGILGEAQIKTDFIDSSDPLDVYKFTVEAFQDVGLYLYDLSANAQMYLVQDLNGNGQVEPDEIVMASESKGGYQDRIQRTLGPGTYFVQVVQAQGDTPYSLWLDGFASEIPPNGAGNGLADALDLGLLDRVQRQRGAIGSANPQDVYKFQLDRPQNLSLFLDELSANATVRLIQDRNFNNAIEPDEVIAVGAEGGATFEELNLTLGPGVYHIEVSGAQTYYELNVAPQRFDRSFGYGVVDASAAVATAIGASPFPQAPQLGGSNWTLDMVNAPTVWNQGYTGAGVIVAVVDGSLDYTHPDLSGKIWNNVDEIAGNGIDDDGNGFVDDVRGWNFWQGNNELRDLDPLEGHATHVAGIIAGTNDGVGTTGVAPDATIMPVRVIGPFTGEDEEIAAGIRYAVDNGAQVINLSLGGGEPNEIQQDALRYARDRGVVVVMASGNDGLNLLGGGKRFSDAKYPAGLATESGLAVGAIARDREIAEFTNRPGTEVLDYLLAPGVDVYSSLPINTFDFWEGTSMATPMVAGVVALMLSANPNLTPEQVEQIVTGTANPNGIIENGVFDVLG